MGKRKSLVAVILSVMLAACSPPAAPESSAPPPPPTEVSAPESESPASAESESVPMEPVDPPESIHIWQQSITGEVYWDLLVIEPEELQLLADLLSTTELNPLEEWEDRWPNGGSPIMIELNYPDATVDACTYRERLEDRGTLSVGEVFYAYPADKHSQFLEFLGNRDIAIMAS